MDNESGGAINWVDFKPKMQNNENETTQADDFSTAKAPEYKPFWQSWYQAIEHFTQKGRPKGSATKYKFANKDEFITLIRNAKIAIEKTGEYPSQERVAETLDYEDSRIIRRLCERYAVNYKDI